MIPIIINNKKYKIKAIDELNTAEFIELSEIEKVDVLKYIAWQTKTTYDEAFFAVSSKKVEKAIGVMPDIRKLKFSKKFDKKKAIATVGQRHQIEGSKITGMKLLVLCLAVAQAQSNDISEVYKLRDKYMKMNYKDVLPSGFFFFKNYNDGRNKGLSILNWQLVLTKILSLRNRLARKN